MNRPHRNRARLGALLLAAVGALAMLALPGIATAKDRNHDRIPDRWEKRHRLSLKVNQAHRDQDRDRLRNRAEFLAGDNPQDADSDDDGVADGEENAGTIKSFDAGTGKLTIDLFNGDTVAGTVTEGTEIECDNQGSASASDDQQGDDDPGEDEGQAGDDQGDEGESADDESGDDNDQGGNCTTADLVPGAVVEEAELSLENGAATFEEVELGS